MVVSGDGCEKLCVGVWWVDEGGGGAEKHAKEKGRCGCQALFDIPPSNEFTNFESPPSFNHSKPQGLLIYQLGSISRSGASAKGSLRPGAHDLFRSCPPVSTAENPAEAPAPAPASNNSLIHLLSDTLLTVPN